VDDKPNQDAKTPADPEQAQRIWEAKIRIFDRGKICGKYCAFIDVLGFGAATVKDLPRVMSIYEQFVQDAKDWAEFLQVVQLSVYSDSFVVTSDKLAPVLHAANLVQWFVLRNGFLVRGGIAHGNYTEGEKAGIKFIVSPALSKAAHLEKTIKHPCVAIHPDIEIPDEVWLSNSRIVMYFDGIRLVSPFNIGWYKSAGNRAAALLNEYPEHANKYKWFLRLFEAAKTDRLIPQDVLKRSGLGS
jgi:hypothetical protein